ncbi:MAG: hypothetical protein RLZZ232_3645 [Planctomycetota bacterium]|jgi:formylglycine-generating enzyme required for sulfatase activity
MQLRCSCCSQVRDCADKVAQRSQFCTHCGRITRFTEIPVPTTRQSNHTPDGTTDHSASVSPADDSQNAIPAGGRTTGSATDRDNFDENSRAPSAAGLTDPASSTKSPISDAALLNEVLLRVRFLHTKCQFGDAVNLLLEQNEKSRTSAVTSLMMQSMYLSDLQDAARQAARHASYDPKAVFRQSEVRQYLDSLKSMNLEDPDFVNPDVPGPKHSRDGAKWTAQQRAITLVVVISLITLVAVFAIRLQEPVSTSREDQHPTQQSRSPDNSTPGNGTESSSAAVAPPTTGPRHPFSAVTAQAHQLLKDGKPLAASQILSRTNADASAEFADQLSNLWRSEIASLESSGKPESLRKSIQYLNGAEQILQAVDQGHDQIRIRQVRCEMLNHLATLLISDGNYPGAIDALVKIASLQPDDPRNQQLATRIAESMVNGMEQGDNRINAELVVPWIDQSERFGVPADIRSGLHQRVLNARLNSIRQLRSRNDERSLLLALDAMQSLQKSHPLHPDVTSDSQNFADSLIQQSLDMLEAGQLTPASLKLKAAISLGLHNASAAATARLVRRLEQQFHAALSDQKFSTAADLYQMLRLLAPEKLPALNAALRLLSARELATLPDWLRHLIQRHTNSIGMQFVLVPRGEFQRSSAPPTENGISAQQPDFPLHQVTLTRPYLLGQFEVTRRQYLIVTGRPADNAETPDATTTESSSSLPCDQLTWSQATAFCQSLSSLDAEKTAGRRYRLPTEAEWEWACLEASSPSPPASEVAEPLATHAWYANNSGHLQIDPNLSLQSDSDRLQTLIARSQPRLQKIGTRQPNALGLHDMQGNAPEWVSDWFADYPTVAVQDPPGPDSGTEKILRGGSYRDDSSGIQASRRLPTPPDRATGGLRVVLEFVVTPPIAPEPATAQAQ